MTWPSGRMTCATGQTKWPIARVTRTYSPSTRWTGHLSRADGQSEWPIGQVGWTVGRLDCPVGRLTRTLPPRVHSHAACALSKSQPGPAPAPTTRPLALVQSGQRLTHQLRLVDESTPTRRARPAGVLGAEVWVKLVDADQPTPTNPAALTFLTMTTKPTFRADFKPGEGGKTAVYMARWINTRGEKGPWSEITTATVAA